MKYIFQNIAGNSVTTSRFPYFKVVFVNCIYFAGKFSVFFKIFVINWCVLLPDIHRNNSLKFPLTKITVSIHVLYTVYLSVPYTINENLRISEIMQSTNLKEQHLSNIYCIPTSNLSLL